MIVNFHYIPSYNKKINSKTQFKKGVTVRKSNILTLMFKQMILRVDVNKKNIYL